MRFSRPSPSPSTSSMTRRCRPAASSNEWTAAMPGWFSAARAFASLSKRADSVPVLEELLRQDLQRDVAVEARVLRPVDLPHPARPEGREDLVRTEAGTGGERHEDVRKVYGTVSPGASSGCPSSSRNRRPEVEVASAAPRPAPASRRSRHPARSPGAPLPGALPRNAVADDRPVPRRADGRAPRASRAGAASSTSASATAASSGRPTTARPGCRSSTASRRSRSGRSPSRPSDPNVLYVGSGEGLQRPDLSVGDGVYRSTDAGKTWTHLGLRDGQQIPAISVDPRDAKTLLVAVLGHPYGANEERGVFRSTDGGETFTKVLYRDENTGAIALARDPSNPDVVYAALWESRQGPWENGEFSRARQRPPQVGRRRDELAEDREGTPDVRAGARTDRRDRRPGRSETALRGRRGAPRAHNGLYRSDDAGESWRRVNAEERVNGRASDFAEVKVDPKNADVVWVANTSTYRSTDGGKTFTAVKGAPGGDDYHTIWIDPDDPRVILLASDQGATITRQRRRDLEQLVQPADRAALPRLDGQPLPVLGLRRASRRAAPSASRAAATTARSRSATGIRSAPRSTPTSPPTR